MAFIGGILSDTLSKLISNIGKTMGLKFIDTVKSKPDKLTEMNVFENSTKQFARSQLLEVERTFDEILEVVTGKDSDLEQAKILDRIRNRISSLRYQIDSASLLIPPQSIEKAPEIIENLSYYHLLIVYYSIAINKFLIDIRDGVEDGSDLNIKENLTVVRKQVSSLEQILDLRPTSTINENTVKILKKQMNDVSDGLVDLFKKITEASYGQIDIAFKEVTLKRPKFFGRQKYMDDLGSLVIKILKNSPNKSMSLQDIREVILDQIKDVKITIDDLDQVGKDLYSKKLIYGIREDQNTTFIDFRATSSHRPKCDNCKKEGGIFMDYYSCPKGRYVCADCISFFGKCKVCGQKVSQNHQLV